MAALKRGVQLARTLAASSNVKRVGGVRRRYSNVPEDQIPKVTIVPSENESWWKRHGSVTMAMTCYVVAVGVTSSALIYYLSRILYEGEEAAAAARSLEVQNIIQIMMEEEKRIEARKFRRTNPNEKE